MCQFKNSYSKQMPQISWHWLVTFVELLPLLTGILACQKPPVFLIETFSQTPTCYAAPASFLGSSVWLVLEVTGILHTETELHKLCMSTDSFLWMCFVHSKTLILTVLMLLSLDAKEWGVTKWTNLAVILQSRIQLVYKQMQNEIKIKLSNGWDLRVS